MISSMWVGRAPAATRASCASVATMRSRTRSRSSLVATRVKVTSSNWSSVALSSAMKRVASAAIV